MSEESKDFIDAINSKNIPTLRGFVRAFSVDGTYYYKDKPYRFIRSSRYKYRKSDPQMLDDGGWKEVVIYEALYKGEGVNEGDWFVRDTEEFLKLFELR